MQKNSLRPIFIIGMGRSGTNLLSKSLEHSICAKNLYEQRYIWSNFSFFNERVYQYSDSRKKTIRKHIQKVASKSNWFIDKTPGNIFRRDAIISVFPEAKFIYLVRDPLDNMSSREVMVSNKKSYSLVSMIDHFFTLFARKNITLKKLPLIFFDQLGLFLIRFFTHVPVLGRLERVPGIIDGYRRNGVLGVFEVQLLASFREYKHFKGDPRYLTLRYEDLTSNPETSSELISNFLDFTSREKKHISDYLEKNSRKSTIGKWKKNERLGKKCNFSLPTSLREYAKEFDYEI